MSKIIVTRAGPQKSVRLAIVANCHGCPHITKEHTPGAGYAMDYHCTAVTPRKLVAGYVEWRRDMREDHCFPDWCPLEKRSVP